MRFFRRFCCLPCEILTYDNKWKVPLYYFQFSYWTQSRFKHYTITNKKINIYFRICVLGFSSIFSHHCRKIDVCYRISLQVIWKLEKNEFRSEARLWTCLFLFFTELLTQCRNTFLVYKLNTTKNSFSHRFT